MATTSGVRRRASTKARRWSRSSTSSAWTDTEDYGTSAGPFTAARYNEAVPKLTIDGRSVEFESGKLPYHEHGKPESILDICLNAGLHLEHACGGNCACT